MDYARRLAVVIPWCDLWNEIVGATGSVTTSAAVSSDAKASVESGLVKLSAELREELKTLRTEVSGIAQATSAGAHVVG